VCPLRVPLLHPIYYSLTCALYVCPLSILYTLVLDLLRGIFTCCLLRGIFTCCLLRVPFLRVPFLPLMAHLLLLPLTVIESRENQVNMNISSSVA